jgi:hypothetical protein
MTGLSSNERNPVDALAEEFLDRRRQETTIRFRIHSVTPISLRDS